MKIYRISPSIGAAKREEIMKAVTDQNVTRAHLPKKNGYWEGKAGNSKWVLNDNAIIKWSKNGQKHEMTGQELKERYKIDGVFYHGKEPNFSMLEDEKLGHVTLDSFSSDRLGSEGTYAKATEAMVQKLGPGWTPKRVNEYMTKNGLTWHECADRRTVRAIPTEINAAFIHTGGTSVENSLQAMGDSLTERYPKKSLKLKRESLTGQTDSRELQKAIKATQTDFRKTKAENNKSKKNANVKKDEPHPKKEPYINNETPSRKNDGHGTIVDSQEKPEASTLQKESYEANEQAGSIPRQNEMEGKAPNRSDVGGVMPNSAMHELASQDEQNNTTSNNSMDELASQQPEIDNTTPSYSMDELASQQPEIDNTTPSYSMDELASQQPEIDHATPSYSMDELVPQEEIGNDTPNNSMDEPAQAEGSLENNNAIEEASPSENKTENTSLTPTEGESIPVENEAQIDAPHADNSLEME